MFKSSRLLVAFGLALLGATFAGTPHALASPAFPAEVQAELEMSCRPRCTLCHSVEPGTPGTASQPFASAMIASGLIPGSEESVAAALAALPDDTDSDGDGISDLDELRGVASQGTSSAGASGDGEPGDPNVTGAGDICENQVLYGCGAAHVAPEPRTPPLGLLVVLLSAGGWLVVRHRHRARG